MFSAGGPRYFSKVAERSQSESHRVSRRAVRRTLLIIILALYVAAVPWYRDPGDPLRILWGLPDWVAVALACYVSVAILNAAAWLLTDFEDSDGERDSEPGDRA